MLDAEDTDPTLLWAMLPLGIMLGVAVGTVMWCETWLRTPRPVVSRVIPRSQVASYAPIRLICRDGRRIDIG